MLADMATSIEAARTLTWKAAWAYDNVAVGLRLNGGGKSRGEIGGVVEKS